MEPISKSNLEGLTNSIYAFTMTLMVRNIQTPQAGSLVSDAALQNYFVNTFLSVLDFIGAFLILGMFWLFFYQMFRRMKTYDSNFLYLHLLSLMIVVFVPFTQGCTNDFTTLSAGEFLFQANYLVLAILLTCMWYYARTHPVLLVPELTEEEASFLAKKFLVPLGVSVLGVILLIAGFGYIDILYLLPFIILLVFFRHPPEEGKDDGDSSGTGSP